MWVTFIASIIFALGQVGSSPVVLTSSGSIRGFVTNSTNGTPFNAFLAIPYGRPPAPQPFGSWVGVRDGSQVGPQCPQFDYFGNSTSGSEDCLLLNVYAPKFYNVHTLLPVMCYIHGGAFVYQSGRYIEYGPQNIMDYPVILVVINYRLGPFGFLCTNDSNAYGNYGMMDQVLALEWIQENIEHFGGDPKRVTIFGTSAGSRSVILHIFSNRSKDLFWGAIAESGSALGGFASVDDPLIHATNLANRLNCSFTGTEELVKCLRGKTLLEIVLAAKTLEAVNYFPLIWVPVVETPGGPGFLLETPQSVIDRKQIPNRVPLVTGHNALEGYTLYNNLVPGMNYTGKEYFQKQFADQLQLFTPVQPYMTKAADAIINEYCNGCDLNNETVFTYVMSEIIGDVAISTPTAQTANVMSQLGLPTYAYIYTYVQDRCMTGLFSGQCGIYCSHEDNCLIEFRFLTNQSMTVRDAQMSRTFLSLWVKFAYQTKLDIDSNEQWPMFVYDKPEYLQLDLSPTIKKGPLSNRTTFWMETIPNIVNSYTKKN